METVIAPSAGAGGPMFIPTNVTVTAVLALTVTVPPTTMIILDSEIVSNVAETPPLTKTWGLLLAKKEAGKLSEILSPALSKPAAVVVKLNVTGTPGRFAIRSEGAIMNATDVTAPPMYPDAALFVANGS